MFSRVLDAFDLKIAIAVFLACGIGFLAGTYILSLPMPKILEFKGAGNEIFIKGKTYPHASIVIFNEWGLPVSSASADGDGVFEFSNLPKTEIGEKVSLRALLGDRRASPARRLNVKDCTVDEREEIIVPEEDLPPLAIPPVSTGTYATKGDLKASQASSTEIESIGVSARLSNSFPMAGEVMEIFSIVNDQKGGSVKDAEVSAVVHYPEGDKIATASSTGELYVNRLSLPETVPAGSTINIDITAKYKGSSSTTRLVFTIQ